MIKYSLICDNDHSFEGWFSSSDDFDAQKQRNLVTCPFCDSENVSKSLMAPNVSTSRKKQSVPAKVPETPPAEANVAVNPEVMANYQELVGKMRELRNHVEANADNVGNKFPEEARKIHYGEAEKRSIYGQASHEEVKDLVDEGVEIMPLPALPEDRN